MSTRSKRVILIGLDGGTFDVLQPLMKEGRLHVLASLLRAGPPVNSPPSASRQDSTHNRWEWLDCPDHVLS